MAHSRLPFDLAALSTESTSTGSRWIMECLGSLRTGGTAGAWICSKFNIMLHFEQIQAPAVPPVRREPRHSMIHLEPVEVLSVLRAARSKGSREWAMVL